MQAYCLGSVCFPSSKISSSMVNVEWFTTSSWASKPGVNGFSKTLIDLGTSKEMGPRVYENTQLWFQGKWQETSGNIRKPKKVFPIKPDSFPIQLWDLFYTFLYKGWPVYLSWSQFPRRQLRHACHAAPLKKLGRCKTRHEARPPPKELPPDSSVDANHGWGWLKSHP